MRGSIEVYVEKGFVWKGKVEQLNQGLKEDICRSVCSLSVFFLYFIFFSVFGLSGMEGVNKTEYP